MPNWELATPRTLGRPGPETDCDVDWRCTADHSQQDFSCPLVVCNSNKTEWKRGGGLQKSTAAGILMKIHKKNTSKNHFLSSCKKFKRCGRNSCKNRYFVFKSDTQEFCLEFEVKVGEVNVDLAWYNYLWLSVIRRRYWLFVAVWPHVPAQFSFCSWLKVQYSKSLMKNLKQGTHPILPIQFKK